MVFTVNDLSAWKDFPKGLRVLLLDEDNSSSIEIRSKLEAMDYIVSFYCNEDEALKAISNKPESFHVAIVEVSTSNNEGTFKFLESVKDLPTIMISNVHCLSTMLKCIALGAVEFLHKPLSDDKLRNIWQHVVHKAFNAGGSVLSEALKPVKDSVSSMLQLQVDTEETMDQNLEKTEDASLAHENGHQLSPASDKYPAPSTPQLKQAGRLLDDGDCHDHNVCSTEKEGGEQDVESTKSVETTCAMVEDALQEDDPLNLKEPLIKEVDDLADSLKSGNHGSCPCPPQTGDSLGNGSNTSNFSSLDNSNGTRANRKKTKVDWTPELHKKFVQAVEQLGVSQAIPSRILEVMKVDGLTRHNVASHLQKYRMHRRHILPKEDDRRWQLHRNPGPRSYYPHKPVMAYPPYHPNPTMLPAPVYPIWGGNAHRAAARIHAWRPSGYPSWIPAENWLWKPYPGMHADAWGSPVLPQIHNPYPSLSQNSSAFHNSGMINNSHGLQQDSLNLYLEEEVIDKVVKEAINNPWMPLPLGLKPPSTDSVLVELSRQDSTILPQQHQQL